MAIADEIAAKESIRPVRQPVHSFAKDPPRSTSRGNSNISPVLPLASRPGSSSKSRPPQSTSYSCFSCGNSDHARPKCRFRNTVRRNCNLKGHVARVCNKSEVNAMCVKEDLSGDQVHVEEELYVKYDVNAMSKSEISVPLKIRDVSN